MKMKTPFNKRLQHKIQSGLWLSLLLLVGCATQPPAKKIQKVEQNQKIFILIDDAGQNLQQVEPFLALQTPLTIAILPSCPETRLTAWIVREKHPDKQLILHQPMASVRPESNPGPGAVLSDTPADQVADILQKNMAQVPGARGMNNHMGSLITQNRDLMEATMTYCKENGLFFIDSFTIPNSIAGSVAREFGVPTAQQQVFLDNDSDEEAIQKQFERGMRIAKGQGFVVMIGHAWSPTTARVIAQMAPQAIRDGYSFHPISDIFLK